MRHILAIKRLTYKSGCLFSSDFTTLDFSLECQHLKKGRIQLVFEMQLKQRWEVKIQGLILISQLCFVFLGFVPKSSPLVLAVVHLADKCLNLCGTQLLFVDSALSCFHLFWSKLTCLHISCKSLRFKLYELSTQTHNANIRSGMDRMGSPYLDVLGNR